MSSLPLSLWRRSCYFGASGQEDALSYGRIRVARSVHVEAAAWFAGETVVCALVVCLVRDDGHVLFVDGEASDVGSFRRSQELLTLPSCLYRAALLHRRTHLLGHERGEGRKAVLVGEGHFWLAHALLGVHLVHRVDAGPHCRHLRADISPCHLTVSLTCMKES